MSTLCLAGGGVLAHLALAAFTLAWTHSVERTGWQEDWRIEGQALVLVEARVQGTGAGMEIPADARLEGGWYRYRPNLALPALTLARSAAVPDWRLCARGHCRPLADLVGDAPVVRLFPCRPAVPMSSGCSHVGRPEHSQARRCSDAAAAVGSRHSPGQLIH